MSATSILDAWIREHLFDNVPNAVAVIDRDYHVVEANSAFEETALEDTLAQLGVTQIVLAGAATNWCIRATAYAALERGYDLTLIGDAHTTGTIELENGVKIEAANIIDELNITMEWVSYPDRKNRSVSAADLDFALTAVD